MKTPSGLELQDRVRWYVAMRWFFVAALGGAGVIPQLLTTGYNDFARDQASIVFTGLFVNLILFAASRRRSSPQLYYRILAGAQIFLDLILASWLILLNGGIESRTVIVYVIPIVMAAALLGRVATYVTGLASAATYVLFISLDHYGVIQPPNILNPALHTDVAYFVRSVFFYSIVLMVLSVLIDFVGRLIQHREQLEQEMRELTAAKAETEAILKTMGSALVATDPNGRITLANNTFEHLTGYRRPEVLGRPINEVLVMLDEAGQVVPPEQRPILNMLKQADLADSPPQIISDYYYRRKNGSSFPFVAHVSPIVLNHQVLGATCVFDDATTSKDMEKLKNNFVALVSHQLKTPISEIKGYIENMLYGLAGKLTRKQNEYLQQMHEVADRSNQMIGNLLDISILQHEALQVRLRPVKVTKVLEAIVEVYKERTKKKQLRLEVKEGNKDLEVVADRDALIEVIGNLISNSISYSHSGTINIETKETADYGIIEVSDQGKGIDPEKLQTIFRKEQVLAEAPAPESGTGLGLYLAHQLVQLQKGNIEASSTVGKGTTFSIQLPKKGAKIKLMADTDNPLLDKNAKTILIVEDELPFRQIYRDILRLDGFNVIEAEDGAEGLEMVKQHKPDLVLLYIVLPKLSGFDVLNTIKKTPALEQIPVIVYSIINNKAEIDRAIKLGANDFTIKGQTPAFEVLNKVRKLLA